MKKETAIKIFDTAVGTRASIVYSEINDDGVIVKDNIRLDRIIVDKTVLKSVAAVTSYAQELVDGLEG